MVQFTEADEIKLLKYKLQKQQQMINKFKKQINTKFEELNKKYNNSLKEIKKLRTDIDDVQWKNKINGTKNNKTINEKVSQLNTHEQRIKNLEKIISNSQSNETGGGSQSNETGGGNTRIQEVKFNNVNDNGQNHSNLRNKFARTFKKFKRNN
ncbi:hypothetical protein KGF54_000731 [Candida jiufengensis]|uniref:uncharacterized protein n=1 Tax=Candida jiufengensis TaxID=497108 RepID=UPI002224360B|nr:uncharacterized protein KGF54_000731 [Candida jiufengensis]KAI5956256.1 hypothetical protein KGF54_000731 [Candida jiufengensis]